MKTKRALRLFCFGGVVSIKPEPHPRAIHIELSQSPLDVGVRQLAAGGGGGVGNNSSVSPKRVLALSVVSVAHIASHCSATP